VGALALAFEQLKKKLAAQGIFDEQIKKSLPFLPQRVAVITSPTGAAIRDFLKIIERRFANIEILIIPVRVQGDEATGDIVEAIDFVNRELQVEVIVLTRGGGSLEDLWAFNQEELALAIRRSGIPVMSAVGHEIDMTISDLAADYRAPTPSAAAELLVVEKESLKNRLKEMEQRMLSTISLYIKNRAQELDYYVNRLKDPRRRLADIWMRLDELHQRLVRQTKMKVFNSWQRMTTQWREMLLHSPLNTIISLEQNLNFHMTTLQHNMGVRLDERQMRLFTLEKQLNDLSPFSILKRGYSITRKLPEQRILKNTLGVQEGDRVKIILAKGELECRVHEVDRDKEI
jgi:exodeoxyribonuclease VII large subunit